MNVFFSLRRLFGIIIVKNIFIVCVMFVFLILKNFIFVKYI